MSIILMDFFKEKEDHYRKKYVEINNQLRIISILRVLIFVAYIIIAIYAANESNGLLLGLISAAFILFFGLAVKVYNIKKYRSDHFQYLLKINQEEQQRLNISLNGLDKGDEYIQIEHPYVVDLDIFGFNSLFQLINRTSTFWGRNLLAKWLLKRGNIEEIISRQKSVKELCKNVNWLQDFQASGRHYHNKKDISVFLNWLKSDNLILGRRFFGTIRFIMPPIILLLLAGVLFSNLHIGFFFLGLIINSLILLLALTRINWVHEQTNNGILSIQAVETLILKIESGSFDDPGLKKIQSVFNNPHDRASQKIGKLKKILEHLDNRSNVFYQIINIGFLLDLHLILAAEKWKSFKPENIESWFDNLAEMEALVSLAGFAFANPSYCFPEISKDIYEINTLDLGHPLIPHDHRVSNNFVLKGKGSIAMITGSNMAGKSTFLRTLGINQVLAFAGCPVCASKMTCSPIQVYTSMRTQDNLSEHISSFYAELKRIQQLIQLTKAEEPVLFILDEILKGTNSKDRHLGAVSLVNQLSGKNSFGLISTHDLSLARETMKSNHVFNFNFSSTIQGDEILFDYILKPGICESFNASKLMEKIGIELIHKKE